MSPIIPIIRQEISSLMVNDVTAPQASSNTSFESLVIQGLDSVNDTIIKADKMAESYALGKTDIQDVMLAMEEANMTMQLAVTVRNKSVEGLQELLRMQL
ncbi:flagellar hook-basal body complex protein FliE [Vibrio cincinnatiensis]|uniref:flagellar hook-basal body complex protein FliE n=1 Tax=Vibrio cincinnatiensis TaxID=675 RepID=UPI001EE0CBE9|nr:flagellar hook-basal body complex protein FliE [Vibrio cincinnatiensis]MCG3723695.1 flagellar hook-basal body complex protein FliE [Vibrio cincinnatiensis]